MCNPASIAESAGAISYEIAAHMRKVPKRFLVLLAFASWLHRSGFRGLLCYSTSCSCCCWTILLDFMAVVLIVPAKVMVLLVAWHASQRTCRARSLAF